ncbi:MAG: tryptophan synthase subunit alpha [Armatimonadetes bacterium]|nr:tryptophan synthase subunit alpha [Armatimonadota bacterium]
MSRLSRTFHALRARREAAFIPFVTCGDPDLTTTRDLALAYLRAGADVLEIGIPFTDPLADGPTIQRASERALAAGTTMDDAFSLLSDLRKQSAAPLVPMTYINPVWQIGYDAFAARCQEIGVDGVIISDLPPEEGQEWVEAGKKHGVNTIFLLAPTSDDARVERVAQCASGFIYAVARLGVTGARSDVPPEIGELVARVRRFSDTPICAGFGFSQPDQIRQTITGTGVDGIVVASALIDRFEKVGREGAASFARELKAATVSEAV